MSARAGVSAAALRIEVESVLAERVPHALTVTARPPLEMITTDLREVNVPRGALSEICGPASSGRTSALFALLAVLTQRQEVCALIDGSDSFHPASAEAAGVDLKRILWVRCKQQARDRKSLFRRLEQALKTTDLLLQSGGFGIVALDLGDLPSQVVQRVPLTTWFRFRRAVQDTPTAFVILEERAHAGSSATTVLETQPAEAQWTGPEGLAHARLFQGLEVSLMTRLKRSGASAATTCRPYGAHSSSSLITQHFRAGLDFSVPVGLLSTTQQLQESTKPFSK